MSVSDHIVFEDARCMNEVADGAAQLVIVSPPYLGHQSQKAKLVEQEFLRKLLYECTRIVTPDGVVATINTDFRDKGMMYLRHMVVVEAAYDVGLAVKDEKIWIRGFGRDVYRKKFSFILVFSRHKRVKQKKTPEYEIDNWVLTRAQTIGGFRDAIAPEIPDRLIGNFTDPGDLVVSACAGTGTAVIAALRAGRRALGYEIDSGMKDIIRLRERDFDRFYSDPENRF